MSFITRAFDWYSSTKAARTASRLPLPNAVSGFRWWGSIQDATSLVGINLAGTKIDYARDVGDVMQNSAVAACLYWICTSWQDAILEVQQKKGADWVTVGAHPVINLLDDPNPNYDGERLAWALLIDYWTHGRAYVHIISVGGVPAELEWMPAYCTWRKDDYYSYRPNDREIKVPLDEVLHISFGISPFNLLEGRPPLEAGLKEIYTDNEATASQATIFRNRGVPSGIIGPDGGSSANGPSVSVSADDADAIKKDFRDKTRGDRRGDVIVFPTSFKYQPVEFDPKKMDYSAAHRTPEERICALFQIPPGVVGMGAGLDRNTYSNAEEANRWAWENNLIPTGNYFAKRWTKGLYSRYRDYRPQITRLAYDRSEVRVLQEDMSAKRKDALDALTRGAILIEEARAEMGYQSPQDVLTKLAEQRQSAQPIPEPTDPGVPAGDQ